MENIQVGEYIRTKDGNIDRVIINYNGKCNNINCNEKHISCQRNYYDESKIVKHSKNIIDLIEKGDFVNNDEVVAIDYTEDDNGNYINVLGIMKIDDDYEYPIKLSRLNIKSVVTKELFNSVKYEVER